MSAYPKHGIRLKVERRRLEVILQNDVFELRFADTRHILASTFLMQNEVGGGKYSVL
jgi:hypothetical protein